MAQPKDSNITNTNLQDVFNYTVKQRLELLASLILDKMEEDKVQGRPLLRRVENEKSERDKYRVTKPGLV